MMLIQQIKQTRLLSRQLSTGKHRQLAVAPPDHILELRLEHDILHLIRIQLNQYRVEWRRESF